MGEAFRCRAVPAKARPSWCACQPSLPTGRRSARPTQRPRLAKFSPRALPTLGRAVAEAPPEGRPHPRWGLSRKLCEAKFCAGRLDTPLAGGNTLKLLTKSRASCGLGLAQAAVRIPMRTFKAVAAASIQLLLVFVLTAGPLPLGIPRAYADVLPTDTPGIKSFYPPRLMIIFDSSQSMGYFPGDLNGYPAYLSQDWDPTVMTPIPNDPLCQSKFCLGKRALYVALPQYSSRIDMGLATYNQYFETASQLPDFRTVCTYDEIAVNNSTWGALTFTAD